jgi:hypothetical protein
MKHRGAMGTMKSLRPPSRFPRIDMPSNPSDFPSPRFGRRDPPALDLMQQILSNIAGIAKCAYRLAVRAAVFRH